MKSCMTEGGIQGCVVVMSAFFIQFLALGTSQSFGVYTTDLLAAYDSNAAAVALVGSLNLGILLGAGPLASLLMRRYNHCQVTLLGAILANIGLVVMPFAPNLEFMYVFYGIFCGLGYSLAYVPSYVLSGLYFPEHQSLATGIAVGGSGFGSAIFPVVINRGIQFYGWRGSLFIISGVNLHLLVLALLLRPIPNKTIQIHNVDDTRINIEVILDTHTSMDTNRVVETLPKMRRLTLRKKVKNYFRSIFSIDFSIYWISCVGWNAGSAIVFIFFPDYAFNAGLSKAYASVSYTMVGVGTGIGCVLGGMLGNLKCVNRIMLYLLANIGIGLIALIIPLKISHTLHGFIIVCTVYGISFGIILSMLAVVTSDLLGIKALGDGIGYLMLSNGIGIVGGPPIAGLLIDAYDDLDLAFYLSGVLSILGGVVMYIVIVRRKVCARIRSHLYFHRPDLTICYCLLWNNILIEPYCNE